MTYPLSFICIKYSICYIYRKIGRGAWGKQPQHIPKILRRYFLYD